MRKMHKALTIGLAATMLAGTLAASTPAEAQWGRWGGGGWNRGFGGGWGGGWHRGGWGWGGGWNRGWGGGWGWGAPAAGLLGGLALGTIAGAAATAPYGGYGYYGAASPYGYGGYGRTCTCW